MIVIYSVHVRHVSFRSVKIKLGCETSARDMYAF